MSYWLLPEFIEDILPEEATRQELLRRKLLDLFKVHGFDLVVPPLIEYLESLLPDAFAKANLRTFRLTDQMSGRMMGLRADITPQVARIDAHLLFREGIVRLCYTGSVLHTLPASYLTTRQPVQIGAEIFGSKALQADLEILRLAIKAVQAVGVTDFCLDLGHMGILRTIAAEMNLTDASQDAFFEALKLKDISLIEAVSKDWDEPWRKAAVALVKLYGDTHMLAEARNVLPKHPHIIQSLDELERLIDSLGASVNVTLDFAQVRSYRYHTGLVFSVYSPCSPETLCRGGRYDNLGEFYGRKRPAVGFTMNLRTICQISSLRVENPQCVYAPVNLSDASLSIAVDTLRAQGVRVIEGFCEKGSDRKLQGCCRELKKIDGSWQVAPIE